jgi:hypothetical protein
VADVLAGPADAQERGQLDDAIDFLRDALAGGSRPAAELTKLGEREGIAKRTLQRARHQLGCIASKDGFRDGWRWSLPPESKTPTRAKAPLSEVWHLRRCGRRIARRWQWSNRRNRHDSRRRQDRRRRERWRLRAAVEGRARCSDVTTS